MSQQRLVSIDPGLRCAGVAEFEGGKLSRCSTIAGNNGEGPTLWSYMARELAFWIGTDPPPDTLVIEQMEYRADSSHAVKDLIKLATISGGVWTLLDDVETRKSVPVSHWIRNRPKRVTKRRVRKRLDDEDELPVLDEALSVVIGDAKYEIYDAVGLGLWEMNRL